MVGRAVPTGQSPMTPPLLTLRPFRSEDLPALVTLFHDSVHRVAAADYTPEQLNAWAPAEPDMERWRQKLGAEEVIVAELAGEIVGFCSWAADGHLDFLYVHHAYQRKGVASALYSAVERSLCARGIGRIHTQASLTAQPFFTRQGFRIVTQRVVPVRGCALPNAVMEKLLK
jgi:putative acetyltransferase